MARVGGGFCQFVVAAGLDHLVGGKGGGEEVGDVDGMDGRGCLGLGCEGEEEKKGEGYNCFCVGHVACICWILADPCEASFAPQDLRPRPQE